MDTLFEVDRDIGVSLDEVAQIEFEREADLPRFSWHGFNGLLDVADADFDDLEKSDPKPDVVDLENNEANAEAESFDLLDLGFDIVDEAMAFVNFPSSVSSISSGIGLNFLAPREGRAETLPLAFLRKKFTDIMITCVQPICMTVVNLMRKFKFCDVIGMLKIRNKC